MSNFRDKFKSMHNPPFVRLAFSISAKKDQRLYLSALLHFLPSIDLYILRTRAYSPLIFSSLLKARARLIRPVERYILSIGGNPYILHDVRVPSLTDFRRGYSLAPLTKTKTKRK